MASQFSGQVLLHSPWGFLIKYPQKYCIIWAVLQSSIRLIKNCLKTSKERIESFLFSCADISEIEAASVEVPIPIYCNSLKTFVCFYWDSNATHERFRGKILSVVFKRNISSRIWEQLWSCLVSDWVWLWLTDHHHFNSFQLVTQPKFFSLNIVIIVLDYWTVFQHIWLLFSVWFWLWYLLVPVIFPVDSTELAYKLQLPLEPIMNWPICCHWNILLVC